MGSLCVSLLLHAVWKSLVSHLKIILCAQQVDPENCTASKTIKNQLKKWSSSSSHSGSDSRLVRSLSDVSLQDVLVELKHGPLCATSLLGRHQSWICSIRPLAAAWLVGASLRRYFIGVTCWSWRRSRLQQIVPHNSVITNTDGSDSTLQNITAVWLNKLTWAPVFSPPEMEGFGLFHWQLWGECTQQFSRLNRLEREINTVTSPVYFTTTPYRLLFEFSPRFSPKSWIWPRKTNSFWDIMLLLWQTILHEPITEFPGVSFEDTRCKCWCHTTPPRSFIYTVDVWCHWCHCLRVLCLHVIPRRLKCRTQFFALYMINSKPCFTLMLEIRLIFSWCFDWKTDD